MSIRFRGSILGNYTEPTTSGASGIYDLDAYSTFAGLNAWPAATWGLYRNPVKGWFGWGKQSYVSSVEVTVTNVVSNTGVIQNDVAVPAGVGTGTTTYNMAAAGYDLDKAVIAGKYTTLVRGLYYNLISNTGVIAADQQTSSPPQDRIAHAAATYGLNKAFFTGGVIDADYPSTFTSYGAIMSETAVWARTSTAVGYSRYNFWCNGYGNDTAIMGGTNATGGGNAHQINYLSNTGVISADSTVPNMKYGDETNSNGASTRYGVGTGILLGLKNNTTRYICYLTNTGVLGSDIDITSSLGQRSEHALTAYGDGKAIIVYGYNASFDVLSTKFLISDTGVIGAETSASGATARTRAAGVGISLT